MINKKYIYKESIGMTAAALGLTGVGALAGHEIAKIKTAKNYYPMYKKAQDEINLINIKIKSTQQKIDELSEKIDLYDNMSEKCTTIECIEEIKDKIKVLEDIIETKSDELYELQRKLSNIRLSDYMNESVGLMIGASFATIAASIIAGYFNGIKEAENLASMKAVKEESIEELKKHFGMRSNALKEAVKSYRTSLRRCDDHRCIEDFTNRINKAMEEIVSSKEILMNRIDEINQDYMNKVEFYKSYYDINVDL